MNIFRATEPWLITNGGFSEWINRAKTYSAEAIPTARSNSPFLVQSASYIVGNTLVCPIMGVLAHKPSMFERFLGATSYGDVEDAIDGGIEKGVKRMIFPVTSPGGTAAGAPELGERIASLASQGIETIAHVEGQAGSAAFYVIAGASRITATKSSLVGSIGTVLELINVSKMLAQAGIEVSVFTSGDLKSSGNPKVPMTKDQAEYLQKIVNDIGEMFRDFVISHRSGVPTDSFRGQSFLAADAKQRNLIDEIVPSLSHILDAPIKEPKSKPVFRGSPLSATASPKASAPTVPIMSVADKIRIIRTGVGIHLRNLSSNEATAASYLESLQARSDADLVASFGHLVDEKANLGDQIIKARDGLKSYIPTAPPATKDLRAVWRTSDAAKKTFTSWGTFVAYVKAFSNDSAKLEKIGVTADTYIPNHESQSEWDDLFENQKSSQPAPNSAAQVWRTNAGLRQQFTTFEGFVAYGEAVQQGRHKDNDPIYQTINF